MFRATTKIGNLKELIRTIECLNDEFVLNNGNNIKVVDTAHVAMTDINIKDSFYLTVDCIKDTKLQLETYKLKDFIRFFKNSDILTMVQVKDRLHLFCDSCEKEIALKDISISEAKIPNLNLPITFNIESKDFKRVIGLASRISDYIKLRVKNMDGKISFISFSESEEQTIRCSPSITDFEGTPNLECISCFPVDYMDSILKCNLNNSRIKVKMGSDYPIMLEWDILEKSVNIKFLLAPRVETE